ncbi:hypothetical protein Tsubulata_041033 [Turnera subulata]|uniref:CCHC-type domain-containing protein n=1 Tax=Turnera subulata TaxID=218843 RepID=A0A9Q0FVP0_9ROSI|nr:hypothetical protein Tsubulata_041033 [Turnera subulata]
MAGTAASSASDLTEPSAEEADLRERSNKKVKRMALTGVISGHGGSGDSLGPDEPRRKSSYLTMLTGRTAEAEMEEAAEEDFEDCYSEDSDSGDEADDDPSCPTIRLTSSDKKRIYQRWKDTLIVKLLGKRVGYRFLHRSLMNQWKPRGEIVMADMGNDFYLLQFTNDQDYQRVLFDGPWVVADHVLIVRRWQPRFDPDEATIDKAVVWVQLPKLYQEYYDKEILLWRIARRVGKPIKVDEVTLRSSRVKFARVCIEVDLTKPLVSKFSLRRRIWRVVYEGLNTVCFQCGRYGHAMDKCIFDPVTGEEMNTGDPHEGMVEKHEETLAAGEELRPELVSNHGPWMIAQRRRRGKPRAPTLEAGNIVQVKPPLVQGSRYAVLSDSHVHEEEPRDTDVNPTPSFVCEEPARLPGHVSKISKGKARLNAPCLPTNVSPPAAPSKSQVIGDVTPTATVHAENVIFTNVTRDVPPPPSSITTLQSFPGSGMNTTPSPHRSFASSPMLICGSPPEPPDSDGGSVPQNRDSFTPMQVEHPTTGSDMLIASEPRVSGDTAERVIASWGFDRSFRVEAHGYSGGIWALWRSGHDFVRVVGHGAGFIHLEICEPNRVPWLCTAVYANPDPQLKKECFEALLSFSQTVVRPWVLLGDFNEVTSAEEKQGGAPVNLLRCTKFREWIEDCHLIDVGYTGPKFTWRGQEHHHGRVYERLDRGLANLAWLHLFSSASIRHLARVKSDHHPLSLFLCSGTGDSSLKPFRFEHAWTTHTNFPGTVKQLWRGSESLPSKLLSLAAGLRDWNKTTFGNIFYRRATMVPKIALQMAGIGR